MDDDAVDDDTYTYGGGDDDYGDDAGEAAAPTRWHQLRARVPVRVDPGRRAAWGVGAAVALAAVVTGLWLMSSRPAPVPVAARVPQVPGSTLVGSAGAVSSVGASSGAAVASAGGSPLAPSTAPAGVVVIDVAGKVRRPGLYRLPVGARIDDAVRAAGGARTGVDISSLNLAAPLADGQQILVGVPGAGVQGPPAAGGSAGSAGSAASGGGTSGPVNLNTATLEQLDALPGVGPVLAQHVLDWRSEHGRFTGVDQLNDVSGIGDVKFAELKNLVSV